MSSISDAFESPVPYKENGLELTLPRLDIDDIAAWCKELHEQRKEPARKLIPGNAPPTERFKLQRAIEFGEPTLDDIADLLYTPAGARACLEKSLIKSGKSAEDVKATLKRISPARVQLLALKVSGLFEAMPPPADPSQNKQGAASDPLAQSPPAPSESHISPSPTGAGQGSSSAGTSPTPAG